MRTVIEPFSKGSYEFTMFQEYWQICKTFWNPVVEKLDGSNVRESDTYWQDLMEVCKDFGKRYGQYGQSLVFALLEEKERNFKTEREKMRFEAEREEQEALRIKKEAEKQNVNQEAEHNTYEQMSFSLEDELFQ